MNVLLTGFEPFGGEPYNPSQAVLDLLPDLLAGRGWTVSTAVLPVDIERVQEELPALLTTVEANLYCGLGLAGARTALSVERIGLNVVDFAGDNGGHNRVDQPIVPDGPLALAATVPIRAMVQASSDAGVPMYVSNTAGTYICNAVLYLGLMAMRQKGWAGFIHMPHAAQYAPHPHRTAALPLEFMAQGIAAAVAAAAVAHQSSWSD